MTARWSEHVNRRLGQIRRGEGDWTGLTRPSAAVVDLAERVASELFTAETPTPSVVPTSTGSLAFEWHKSGWTVELEVDEAGVEVWARELSTGVELDGPLSEHHDAVVALLGRLATADGAARKDE